MELTSAGGAAPCTVSPAERPPGSFRPEDTTKLPRTWQRRSVSEACRPRNTTVFWLFCEAGGGAACKACFGARGWEICFLKLLRFILVADSFPLACMAEGGRGLKLAPAGFPTEPFVPQAKRG